MEFKVGDSSDFIKEAVGTNILHHKNQISLKDLLALGKPIVLLVDADIVAYRCSATTDGRAYTVAGSQQFSYKKEALKYCEDNGLDPKNDILQTFNPEPEIKALGNVESSLKILKRDLQGSRMELYLTPSTLFRSEYMSDYKKNREGVRKPHHLSACKSMMTKNYHAETVDGYEADDLLAIRARQLIAEGECTPVICSLDKDLDTVSCYHYQWTKKCIYFVTPEEATLFFYKQLLMGDAVDNIPGIKGVGPVTADKILEDCDGSSSYACYTKVLEAYLEKSDYLVEEDGSISETKAEFQERIVRTVTRNARLLYILHRLAEVWQPPVEVK